MKKLVAAMVISIFGVFLAGCSFEKEEEQKVPVNNGFEDILFEDILFEEIITEDIIIEGSN